MIMCAQVCALGSYGVKKKALGYYTKSFEWLIVNLMLSRDS